MLSMLDPVQIEALKLRVLEWMQRTTLVRSEEEQIEAVKYRNMRIKCPMLCPRNRTVPCLRRATDGMPNILRHRQG
jgi:hypothetical protein